MTQSKASSNQTNRNVLVSTEAQEPPTFVDIKPISDNRRLEPKGFPQTSKKLVARQQQCSDILKRLEKAFDDPTNPGVYLSGPAGSGKSILSYMITQECKFIRKYLTIYIPDCRAWANPGSNAVDILKAKGAFLDYVLDALSTEEMKAKFSTIYDKLVKPPNLGYSPPPGQDWAFAASGEGARSINALYGEVTVALITSRVNVLFVCDHIHALWEGCHLKEPWNLTIFQPKFFRKGALLLSGTTDNDFIGNIPNGLEKHAYRIGKFSNDEFEEMRNLDGYEFLADIEKLEAGTWQSVADAAGNIPRELRQFVELAEKRGITRLFNQINGLNEDEDDRETKKAKIENEIRACVKMTYESWRADNIKRHDNMLTKVINHQNRINSTVFEEKLHIACEHIFLKGREAPITNEVLRVPNFVESAVGMYPTTVDAQKVFFEWFCKRTPNNSLASLFRAFMDATNGSDRGHKFEDYLAAKLTTLGSEGFSNFVFRDLNSPDQQRLVPLQVSERVFTSAEDPPRNFQHFAENTLLTHRATNGGEARVDLIHYRMDRVIFIEATVGNYRDSKIPKEGNGREDLIVETLQKWLGKDIFSVKVGPVQAHGKELASSKKELSVSYKSVSQQPRPDPPKIHYVVATTCPKTVMPIPSRINKYSWINVCFLEDLITANIIPADCFGKILEKQAEDAK